MRVYLCHDVNNTVYETETGFYNVCTRYTCNETNVDTLHFKDISHYDRNDNCQKLALYITLACLLVVAILSHLIGPYFGGSGGQCLVDNVLSYPNDVDHGS